MTNKKTCTTKKHCKSDARRMLKCLHASLLFVAGAILMLGGAFMVKGTNAADVTGYPDGTYIRDTRDVTRDIVLINRDLAKNENAITIKALTYKNAVKGIMTWIGVRDLKNYFTTLASYKGGEDIALGVKNFPATVNEYVIQLKDKNDTIISTINLRLLSNADFLAQKLKITDAQKNSDNTSLGLGFNYAAGDEVGKNDVQVEFLTLKNDDFTFMNQNLTTEEIAQKFLSLINASLNVFQKNMITFFEVVKATMTQLDELTLKITAYRDEMTEQKAYLKANAIVMNYLKAKMANEGIVDLKSTEGLAIDSLLNDMMNQKLDLKNTVTAKALNNIQKAAKTLDTSGMSDHGSAR